MSFKIFKQAKSFLDCPLFLCAFSQPTVSFLACEHGLFPRTFNGYVKFDLNYFSDIYSILSEDL